MDVVATLRDTDFGGVDPFGAEVPKQSSPEKVVPLFLFELRAQSLSFCTQIPVCFIIFSALAALSVFFFSCSEVPPFPTFYLIFISARPPPVCGCGCVVVCGGKIDQLITPGPSLFLAAVALAETLSRGRGVIWR